MYGISMEYVWNMCGISMEYVWNKYGICREYRLPYDRLTTLQLADPPKIPGHGICMECAWNMHGICMGCAWNMSGLWMENFGRFFLVQQYRNMCMWSLRLGGRLRASFFAVQQYRGICMSISRLCGRLRPFFSAVRQYRESRRPRPGDAAPCAQKMSRNISNRSE